MKLNPIGLGAWLLSSCSANARSLAEGVTVKGLDGVSCKVSWIDKSETSGVSRGGAGSAMVGLFSGERSLETLLALCIAGDEGLSDGRNRVGEGGCDEVNEVENKRLRSVFSR